MSDASDGSETGADARPGVDEGTTTVAIACQGGGSHTAFTAGVLRGLLANWRDEDRLVGLSGSSGGAINALLTWYGLEMGGPAAAADRLEDFWADIAASDLSDRWTNEWAVWGSRVRSSGAPVPEVSPYDQPFTRVARDRLRRTIERYVEFERVPDLAGGAPTLIVGTVDVNGGEFETFVDGAVTIDALLASTAVPDLFEAVEIDGHWHWDGLFSQNPPVHDLVSESAEKPDEIWVVQINPQERSGEPTSMEEIADRRNELSGNLSLNQEIAFIERVNDWVAAGHLPDSYKQINVRRVELDRELHCSSKLDRSPSFLRELVAGGEAAAAAFLDDRAAE
jgi:NTE family protein